MNAKNILTGLTVLGIALCFLGVLIIGNGIRHHMIPVKDAEILSVRDMGYIHGAGDDIRNEYTEDVLVKTADGLTVNVTVKRMDKQALPGIGDSIRIYGSQEFSSWYEKSGIWFVYGTFCLFFGGSFLKMILSRRK